MAVSSLLNSTARHAFLDVLDTLTSTRSTSWTCCVETWRAKWNTGFTEPEVPLVKLSNCVTHFVFISHSAWCVVGVEHGTSETMSRTSNRRKNGGRGIFDAWKVRPAGPSRHLCCVFVQRRPKRRMARPEGASRWAHFFVACDQKRQVLSHVVSPYGVSKGPIHHTVVHCLLSSHSFPPNHITIFSCAYTVHNCSKMIINDWYVENRK